MARIATATYRQEKEKFNRLLEVSWEEFCTPPVAAPAHKSATSWTTMDDDEF